MRILKRLAFGALALMLVVLATATVVEKISGTHQAHEWFYNNLALAILWLVIALSGLAYILMRKMWKRLSVLLLHLSLLVILAGAAITWFTAEHGKMQVPQGQAVNVFTSTDGEKRTLPFSVSLQSFDIKTYPGTQAPLDFVSHIMVSDEGGVKAEGTVSMNKVFKHHGYRFFQSGYDAQGRGAVFTVAHDPWGIAVTYAGYGLLLVGMLAVLIDRKTMFRRLLRHPALRRGVASVIVMATAFAANAQPQTLPRDLADEMGDLYILWGDRICPFQTFARQFTTKLYGKPVYKGLTAEQVATGWMFYYDDWKNEPMIKVKNGNVRRLLAINGKYASLEDFYSTVASGTMQHAIDSLQAAGDDATIRALGEADERYQIANMVAAGSILKLFPLMHNGELKWYSHGSLDIPHDIDDGKWLFMRSGMDYLYEMIARKDWKGASGFIAKLRKYQVKECAGQLPSENRFRAEKLYNSMDWDRPLAMLLATLGIVLFIVTCRPCVARSRRLPRWAEITAMTVLVLSLIYLTVSLALRWVVSGHVPMSNGYETMQFMSWATMIIALLFGRRSMLALPFGILVAGLALMVASFGESNPQITQLMPVLTSPLLSIHVAVIMVAYALLAFLMLGGIMALTLRHDGQMVERLHVMGQIILYPAVFLLTAGIFIGAVWANVSWGTYWSWDPKETWALITLIIYAFPLHGQSLPMLRKPLFFHAYCIIAFLSVLVTYFGVNFILGGMHSYA